MHPRSTPVIMPKLENRPKNARCTIQLVRNKLCNLNPFNDGISLPEPEEEESPAGVMEAIAPAT